jgi:hypothetical protein
MVAKKETGVGSWWETHHGTRKFITGAATAGILSVGVFVAENYGLLTGDFPEYAAIITFGIGIINLLLNKYKHQ